MTKKQCDAYYVKLSQNTKRNIGGIVLEEKVVAVECRIQETIHAVTQFFANQTNNDHGLLLIHVANSFLSMERCIALLYEHHIRPRSASFLLSTLFSSVFPNMFHNFCSKRYNTNSAFCFITLFSETLSGSGANAISFPIEPSSSFNPVLFCR